MKLSILIIGLFLFLNVFSQENLWYEKDFPAYKNYFFSEFGIEYTMPEEYKNLNKYYIPWKVSKNSEKHIGDMYGPIFISKDRECILAYPGYLSKIEDNKSKYLDQRYPRIQITAEIKTALGLYYSYKHPLNNDTAKFNFYDYVTCIMGKKAHEMFNADSIFIYDLPNADSVYFFDESLEKKREKKYPHCTGMFIYKKDRSTINVKFFFTHKGKKKMYKYLGMLNKHIWYDDTTYND